MVLPMNNEIVSLLRAAIECSIFLNPKRPGLTYNELMEVGRRTGYQDGEIGDALPQAGDAFLGQGMIVPDNSLRHGFHIHFRGTRLPESRRLRFCRQPAHRQREGGRGGKGADGAQLDRRARRGGRLFD